jgi:hypothetical protein
MAEQSVNPFDEDRVPEMMQNDIGRESRLLNLFDNMLTGDNERAGRVALTAIGCVAVAQAVVEVAGNALETFRNSMKANKG